jgi:outer membrane protein OmpA-like peptidoglycan-associated protein
MLGLVFGLPEAFSQKIELKNPSFEDVSRHSATPYGWYDCGPIDETAPDIQPGHFKVEQKAADKGTYVGLVTRDNDTWEGISQRLSQPIKAGTCYSFSISLARSEKYVSISKTTRVEENFNKPIRLRIWGGTSYCSKKQKLAETATVKHTSWKDYTFKLSPKGDYSYIYIEAFFEPSLFPYNGNILVDNCSVLEVMPCDDIPEPIADSRPNRSKQPKPKKKKKKKTTTTTTTTVEKPVEKPKKEIVAPKKKIITPELERSKITKGKVIQVNNLYFKADSFRIKHTSFDALEEVYDFLRENPDVKIEVGGHTNGVPPHSYCDKLSSARAKAVVEYLIEKGINKSRLTYKGYGKRKPVATNETKAGRNRNQRVEVKILSFDG